MGEDRFLRSLFVQPRAVLGRQLLPLSAYHVAALSLLGSPFFHGGTVDHNDVILAVFACSFDSVNGPPSLFPLDVQGITKWAETASAYDPARARVELDAHIEDYIGMMPELWPRDNDKSVKTSGVPLAFHAVATVLQNMHGITEYEAWNMPFNRLVGYKCAILEGQGFDVKTEHERDLMARLEAAQAAEKAAAAAQPQEPANG
jgi:hypothetical protein